MKKQVVLLITGIIFATLTGCGNQSDNENSGNYLTKQEQSESVKQQDNNSETKMAESETDSNTQMDESVEAADYTGTWVLDGAKTKEHLLHHDSMQEMYGTGLSTYGATMEIDSDNHIKYYIGIGIEADGTWSSGNQALQLAVTDRTEGSEVQRVFELQVVEEDGVTYLVMDSGFGESVEDAESLYWILEEELKKTTSSDSVAESQDSTTTNFAGIYTDTNDGSTLEITETGDNTYQLTISLFRLTLIDDGVGSVDNGILSFQATDAAGNPIFGTVTKADGTYTLEFTDSTWDYLPNGTTFCFE